MFPKPTKIVSKKIRASAKFENCTLRVDCRNHNSVVFAHLNTNFKGIGNKSPDLFGVYACDVCHILLDSGQVDYQDQLRALTETQMRLYEKGLIKIIK